LVELLDAGGELEVAVGQSTLGVAAQGQDAPVSADIDAGMVAAASAAATTSRTEVLAIWLTRWHGSSFRAKAIVRHHGIGETARAPSFCEFVPFVT
jgi:hypothetical protein